MSISSRTKSLFPKVLQAGVALLSAALLLVMPALPQETTTQTPVPQKPVPLKLKSESLALGLSCLGTFLPLGFLLAMGMPMGNKNEDKAPAYISMAALAIITGPSWGYFYGGVPNEGWKGMGIRAGLIFGVFSLLGSEILGSVCMIGIFASIVWDILAVRIRVHEHNLELQRKAMTVAPIIYPDKKGVGVGIQIQLRF